MVGHEAAPTGALYTHSLKAAQAAFELQTVLVDVLQMDGIKLVGGENHLVRGLKPPR